MSTEVKWTFKYIDSVRVTCVLIGKCADYSGVAEKMDHSEEIFSTQMANTVIHRHGCHIG